MDKRFWGILILVVVVLGGIFWITSGHKANAPSSADQATNHVQGQNKYNIKLLEYGDYECPFCEEYYPIVKQVATEYAPYISFQFRNLPLTQIHPNAFSGARAAEAAAIEGQFWQMHDMLYNYQSQWVNSSDPLAIFDVFAKNLGLNVTTFNTDYASAIVNSRINADVAAFGKTGAQEATPTFFLDNKQIQPAPTVSSFEKFINAEIKKKGFTPPPPSTSSSSPTATPGQSVQ